jgi:hypothetical protein
MNYGMYIQNKILIETLKLIGTSKKKEDIHTS